MQTVADMRGVGVKNRGKFVDGPLFLLCAQMTIFDQNGSVIFCLGYLIVIILSKLYF